MTGERMEGLMATLPRPTTDSAPFWDGCNAQRLMLQRCASCRHLFYYARRLCPACGGDDLAWEASTGRGTVYSFSEVHVAFQGPGWNDQIPYVVVLVDLDDGPRMLSRWVGPRLATPAIGDRVHVVFPSVQGQRLPFFAPHHQETP
jgi:uncharacterized OB-fold protein